jgi:hypothetical protein
MARLSEPMTRLSQDMYFFTLLDTSVKMSFFLIVLVHQAGEQIEYTTASVAMISQTGPWDSTILPVNAVGY